MDYQIYRIDKIMRCDRFKNINFEDIIDDEKNILHFRCSSMCNFEDIINKISKFNFIRIRIYLEYLDLETIPKSIFNLKNIVELNLNYNKLKTIPSEITKLTKLEILFIAHNKFEDFPTSVCECINLKFLDISWCKLKTIPLCITKLINIETLLVGGNNFNLLPKIICKLYSLKYLNPYFYFRGMKIPHSIHDLQNYKCSYILSTKKIYTKKLVYRLYVLLIKNYFKFNFKIINKLLKY